MIEQPLSFVTGACPKHTNGTETYLTASGETSMETIWAPWRLAYVAGDSPADKKKSEAKPKEESCFLCRYHLDDPAKDRENLVLLRGDKAMVVFNRYPYNNGHLLVTPQEHIGDLLALSAGVQMECQQLIAKMVALLRETIHPDGFNIGLNLGHAAGAGLPGHLHWHIVPRWNGDTNFMPVVSNTKVIPQSLDALFELLDRKLASP